MQHLMQRRTVLSLAMVGVVPSTWTQPTAWPSRPIKLVAGGVGGVTDIRARWLAERLAAALGQPVVVENIPGAGGNVGAALVAHATADGYTLLLTHQGIAAINPHIYANPGYDALRDFVPVARLGIGAQLLAVPTASPLRSVTGLIAHGKARPGSMNYGSPGIGTPPHLAAVQFLHMAHLKATHVPYKGGGAMMTALLAGEVDWAIEGLTATLPHVKAGSLRALAVSTPQRAFLLPEVPTLAEAGVPGYAYLGWTGVAAPVATPVSIVERLNREINQITTSEQGRHWFQNGGADPGAQSPAEFAAFVQAEHARLGALVRGAGLRAE